MHLPPASLAELPMRAKNKQYNNDGLMNATIINALSHGSVMTRKKFKWKSD